MSIQKNLCLLLAAACLLFPFPVSAQGNTGQVTTDTSGTLNDTSNCTPQCQACTCNTPIIEDHKKMRGHTTSEFEKHRNWIVSDYFIGSDSNEPAKKYGILPAMMLMTEQLTAVGMQQVQIIGSFLDAKHQLETQRLFQELTAQAHKDYHPSEGMCEIGTNVRSLAASERRSDLGQVAFSQRAIQRQLLSGDGASRTGPESDRESRLDQFIKTFCNPKDNGGGLEDLCKGGGADKERMNKDVDFTRTMDAPLTLDVDFTKPATGDDAKDMEDVMALSSNLFAHEVVPLIGKTVLANDKGLINRDAGPLYLDIRALTAKRSVAQNSFAALAAMKSKGSPEVAPFLKKLVEEMGIPKDEVEKYIGKEPSYFAQMEVLSKKIYQNPVFYTELYDKPVNVERKAAALEAIGLMQDRDIYRSLLRSEAIGSVILERMLERDQEALTNEINDLDAYRGGG